MANDANARHGGKPSRGRSDATKNNVEAERDTNATLGQITRLIQTGKLQVTAEEMKKLRKLRGEIMRVNKACNLHRPVGDVNFDILFAM